jgi:hypothetical protein
MYCPTCGKALSQKLKYCNHCGALLGTANEKAENEAAEKRLDDYLTDLFWVTVVGLGLILGGMAMIKKALGLSEAITIGYMILSSTAFLIMFALHLKEILRLITGSKKLRDAFQAEQLDTNELGPAHEQASLQAAPSVTENTTRSLEQVSKEQVPSRN